MRRRKEFLASFIESWPTNLSAKVVLRLHLLERKETAIPAASPLVGAFKVDSSKAIQFLNKDPALVNHHNIEKATANSNRVHALVQVLVDRFPHDCHQLK